MVLYVAPVSLFTPPPVAVSGCCFFLSTARGCPRPSLSAWLLSVCVLRCWQRLWRRLVDDAEKFNYIPDEVSEDDADVAESEEYEDDE